MWNLQKAFSLRTIKICRFEIIDGVKCLLHKTRLQISSEGTSRVCGRSLTLASICFLLSDKREETYIRPGICKVMIKEHWQCILTSLKNTENLSIT